MRTLIPFVLPFLSLTSCENTDERMEQRSDHRWEQHERRTGLREDRREFRHGRREERWY